VEGDPDRPGRAAGHLGDLGVVEPGVPAQEQDLPLTRREPRDGLLEPAQSSAERLTIGRIARFSPMNQPDLRRDETSVAR